MKKWLSYYARDVLHHRVLAATLKTVEDPRAFVFSKKGSTGLHLRLV